MRQWDIKQECASIVMSREPKPAKRNGTKAYLLTVSRYAVRVIGTATAVVVWIASGPIIGTLSCIVMCAGFGWIDYQIESYQRRAFRLIEKELRSNGNKR